jgi:hypothetical protein
MDIDLSSSTMQFLKADQVIQDLQSEGSSSSFSDASSMPNEERPHFIAVQRHCATIALFHRRGMLGGPLTGARPIAIRPICIDREIIQAPDVTGWEIIPWRPIPHAIALQLWPDILEARRRAAQHIPSAEENVIQLTDAEHGPISSDPMNFEFQVESNRPSPPTASGRRNRRPTQKRTLALPWTSSSSNPSSPLVQDSLRRSSRISASKEGYWNVRVDKEPSKKRKISAVLIDEATGQAGPIPLAILQGWGVKCGVAPGELTDDVLLQAPAPAVVHEDDST